MLLLLLPGPATKGPAACPVPSPLLRPGALPHDATCSLAVRNLLPLLAACTWTAAVGLLVADVVVAAVAGELPLPAAAALDAKCCQGCRLDVLLPLVCDHMLSARGGPPAPTLSSSSFARGPSQSGWGNATPLCNPVPVELLYRSLHWIRAFQPRSARCRAACFAQPPSLADGRSCRSLCCLSTAASQQCPSGGPRVRCPLGHHPPSPSTATEAGSGFLH